MISQDKRLDMSKEELYYCNRKQNILNFRYKYPFGDLWALKSVQINVCLSLLMYMLLLYEYIKS